ncbi:hypothetical protein GGR42_002585 [Saonia flava]|uniref:2TM domain-containing protein n=1 Tax=Saonia flava TaxID=523696 RepID=A0A846R411_9FLAO|nr:2TM domain-containing protein [Saonia flava]NJB72094.1 hypothetical protein [Saonia flava]
MGNKENAKYLRAKKKVTALKGFYTHTFVIAVVMPFLLFINYKTYWDYQWFWYPLVSGILSVIIHGLVLMGNNSNWEERKIREYMDKDNINY